MFSGIIETLGTLIDVTPTSGGVRITIEAENFLEYTMLGDSISVNGVCLTVIQFDAHTFSADVSKETLHLTTFGECSEGDQVNLEYTLTLNKGIDGHLVSGHVDTLGEVVVLEERGDNCHLKIKVADEFDKYIVKKGSITVNGVSLTVNEVSHSIFALNIIPHTLKCTNLQHLKVGSKVNVEVDLLARHLEKLLQHN